MLLSAVYLQSEAYQDWEGLCQFSFIELPPRECELKDSMMADLNGM